MTIEAACASCGKREGAVFHRPASECVYATCEYDEGAHNGHAACRTGDLTHPHPTSHHTFANPQQNTKG